MIPLIANQKSYLFGGALPVSVADDGCADLWRIL